MSRREVTIVPDHLPVNTLRPKVLFGVFMRHTHLTGEKKCNTKNCTFNIHLVAIYNITA